MPALALATPAPAVAASRGGCVGPVYPTAASPTGTFNDLPNLWGVGSATSTTLKNGDSASLTATTFATTLPAGVTVTSVKIEASFSASQQNTSVTVTAFGASPTAKGTFTQIAPNANTNYSSTYSPGTWTAADFASGVFKMTVLATSATGSNVVSVDYVRVTVCWG